MNAKTAKLIKRHSAIAGLSYDASKRRWYALTRHERTKARFAMASEIKERE